MDRFFQAVGPSGSLGQIHTGIIGCRVWYFWKNRDLLFLDRICYVIKYFYIRQWVSLPWTVKVWSFSEVRREGLWVLRYRFLKKLNFFRREDCPIKDLQILSSIIISPICFKDTTIYQAGLKIQWSLKFKNFNYINNESLKRNAA